MLINKSTVDNGPWLGLPDATFPEPENSRAEALHRTIKHHLKEIQSYILLGKLVFWIALFPCPKPVQYPFGRNFGRRNEQIAKILHGTGIVFINPFTFDSKIGD